MTLPRLRRQQPSLGRRPDRWSDMLRGAAIAVVLIGTLGSALGQGVAPDDRPPARRPP